MKPKRSLLIATVTLALLAGPFAADAQAPGSKAPAPPGKVPSNPERDAYFGQTHVHTSWSFDAYIMGTTLTGPEEAYQYAMGLPIKHPAGYVVQLKHPIDFQAVTDHSEYAGAIRLANTPGSELSKLPIAEKLKVKSKDDIQRIYLYLGGSIIEQKPIKELADPNVVGSVWKQIIEIADKYNQPGKFTTFVGYEWTSTPDNRNMHRNIIFKDSSKVCDLPFSSMDSVHPEDLWTWMDGQRKAGHTLLAISHNANLSDGIMFPLEVDSKSRPIDAAWAQDRMNNEPLTEIQQLKGASETHPDLSPTDEFAGHEILNYLLGGVKRTPKIHGSYIREAYENGIAFQDARGYNPYKFGVVGASDSHDTAVSYTESTFFGGHGLTDATPEARIGGGKFAGADFKFLGASGLGGVWAESNTRESIYDAMARKETFGTSGVRIKVRFFGGWSLSRDGFSKTDWVRTAYAKGVPMGADLPAMSGAHAPSFIVWAVKDPDDGNLDRIQIIKGWTHNGQIFEKIFDVAWSGNRKPNPATGRVGPVGTTVDLQNATYTNTIGSSELKAVWTDPEFDPSLHAFYYARVLQIPTPRWTTYDAKKLGVPLPEGVPATVQERAWTSPIWYAPSAEARKNAKSGVTVAQLKQRGATPLNDEQLKQLLVGKKFKVRNTVTGQYFDILYGKDGRRLILSVDGKQPDAGELGDVMNAGALGDPAQYEIVGSQVVTTVHMTPFAVTVYKVSDKYIAARDNEFGYANYEFSESGS